MDGGDAEFSARQLVAAATDRSISQLVADFPLTAFQRDIQKVHELVERRLKGEPLAYVLGQWEFYGLTLTVTPDVLIPRDDTEAVCDLAISQTRRLKQNPRVLDLCAGTAVLAWRWPPGSRMPGSPWGRSPRRPSGGPKECPK